MQISFSSEPHDVGTDAIMRCDFLLILGMQDPAFLDYVVCKVKYHSWASEF